MFDEVARLRQAQGLGLDEPTCLQLLEFLVDARFFDRPAQDIYTRPTDNYSNHPRVPARPASYTLVR
jgi:hypothetical protein